MHCSGMHGFNLILCFSQVVNLLLISTLLGSCVLQVECLNFSYTYFNTSNQGDFIRTDDARLAFDAIQVTLDVSNNSLIQNLSGRIWYKEPFRLWSKQKNITASFNSTFVINITPKTNPGGEGLAFILTKESGTNSIPENSHGQWLGIVNSSTNGSPQSNIVAIEFDTKKSYSEDIDDNHVGVDVNTVYSSNQSSLTDHGVNLSSASDVTATIQYDGESKHISIFVFMTNDTRGHEMTNPVISMPLDLSVLDEDVFVGFSGSTGEDTELNCIKSWSFASTEIDNGTRIDDDAANLWWVWLVVAMVVGALLCAFIFYLCWKRKKGQKQVREEDTKVEIQIQSTATAPQKFKLKELKHATENFHPKNMLGKGGCGIVYKGTVSNKVVAVKRFSKGSSQGTQDFLAEVTIIGNLRHKNLVKLVGWCYERNELLVVYEFMPNGSLDKLIFYSKNEDMARSTLSWERRHGIIFGVAQALDYLHNGNEKMTLHRDIKASNIMLDSEFNARLGDFGLARTIQVAGQTHHSTKDIAGTPGYMAPESFLTGGRSTAETDVYAFGVLILEVVCGRRPGNQNEQNNYNNNIVNWVWELHHVERIIDAIDIGLNGNFEEEQVKCMLMLGLACCHPNPYQRPSMRTSLQVLTGEAAPPPIPSEKPVFTWPVMPPSFKENLDSSLMGGQLTPITVLSGR